MEEQKDTWGPPGGEPEWMRWFDELAELTLAERSARLAELARDRPDLARRLEQLFAAEEESSPLLLSQPVAERAPDLLAAAFGQELGRGTRIGPYRLLELLGRGGMGEVYLAERADGVFDQQVALKLVKRGMDSDEIVRRFHRERQILARLEHPGIARILDGGTAPDGRPYFVLERVEGEPILAYCRRLGLPLEERLGLVIAACEAVDAAHRNLVVHRDLKPSNLLVSTGGQVKLLDFGIAKLLAEEEDQATQQERRLLTPAYAAPEQILGEPVTTATDVYALGVILYELLTGGSPHPRNRTLTTVVQGEGRETAERPSTMLRRSSPGAEGDAAGIPDRRRFARRLQGDLDTVVLTALRRDPLRRYRSAADLAADLRRFLEGRPVQARPDTALYRAKKLVLRHKLAAAALVAAVVSLVAGTVISLREAEIARAQAQRAERVKEFLLSIFREADPESQQGAPMTAREILAEGARRVETEMAEEPEVQAELLDAIAQIERSLGDFVPAQEAGEAALARRRKLFGADSPEAALSLTTLAEVAASRGRLDEALRLAEQARPAVAERFGAGSLEVLRVDKLRALLLKYRGENEKALLLSQEMTAASRRRFGPGSLETAQRLIEMAVILSDLSRYEESERTLREALALLGSLPSEAIPQQTLFNAHLALADLLEIMGRDEEAAAEFATVLGQQRAAVGEDHLDVALTEVKYGFLLMELRQEVEAEKTLRNAVRILDPIGHPEAGSARRYLGYLLMKQQRHAEAEQQFLEVERFFREKLGAGHPMVWATRLSLGQVKLRLGKLEEAERILTEVMAYHERIEPEGNEIRSTLKSLGEVRRLQGRVGEALALHRRALAIELKIFGTPAHLGVAASQHQIALDLLARGRSGDLAEARREIDGAITFLRRTDPENPRLDEFLLAGGRIALAAGDRTRARQILTETASRLREHQGADHPSTREAESLLRGLR